MKVESHRRHEIPLFTYLFSWYENTFTDCNKKSLGITHPKRKLFSYMPKGVMGQITIQKSH